MVAFTRRAAWTLVLAIPWLLGADNPSPKPPLPPIVRTKMMMALLGLVVLGIGLVAAMILGGRMVRRMARQRTAPSGTAEDAWYAKPLPAPPPDEAGEGAVEE
jgi:hypothetical protein